MSTAAAGTWHYEHHQTSDTFRTLINGDKGAGAPGHQQERRRLEPRGTRAGLQGRRHHPRRALPRAHPRRNRPGGDHVQRQARPRLSRRRRRQGARDQRHHVLRRSGDRLPARQQAMGALTANINKINHDTSTGTSNSRPRRRTSPLLDAPNIDATKPRPAKRSRGWGRSRPLRRPRSPRAPHRTQPGRQQGGMVIAMANAEGADEDSPRLLAHHRVPQRARVAVPAHGMPGPRGQVLRRRHARLDQPRPAWRPDRSWCR